MYLLWCRYPDKSGEPVFLGVWKSKDQAQKIMDILLKAVPAMRPEISFVEWMG